MKEDWVEASLGEVCFTTSGGTPKRGNKSYYQGNIPWVKSGELNNNVITESSEYISEEALKKSSAKLFPKGTILFALYGATIGKMAILGIEASTNQAICGIFESRRILNSQYLYYYLFSQKRNLIEQGIGGAQPNISQTILKKLNISIAPIPIQRKIVGKVEELFNRLDRGITDLKKTQQQLKIYKLAVLKRAFEGNYEISTLGEIAIWGSGGTPSRKKAEYYEGEIPWLKTGELGGKYVIETEEKITKQAVKNSSAKIFPTGSVGIAMYGATIGKCSIFGVPLSTNQACAVAQPLANITSEFLYYYLISQKNNFVHKGIGGAQPNISQTILKLHPIPLPNLQTQEKIVKNLEKLLSNCEAMEKTIREIMDKSEGLRQSIFKYAFEGRLLSQQEIEKCKQEHDYEPASVLLEKIKVEKKKK